MSHFYGTLQGSRGEATRCGTKGSGVVTHAASYEGAVRVGLYHYEGKDYARVSLTTWCNAGIEKEIYHGPVGSFAVPEVWKLFAHVVDEADNQKKVNGKSVTVTIPKEVYEQIKDVVVKEIVTG
jgi:hypothetical protein